MQNAVDPRNGQALSDGAAVDPCGLMPYSYFNDSYVMSQQQPGGALTIVDLDVSPSCSFSSGMLTCNLLAYLQLISWSHIYLSPMFCCSLHSASVSANTGKHTGGASAQGVSSDLLCGCLPLLLMCLSACMTYAPLGTL